MKEVQSHTDAIQKTLPTIVGFIDGGSIRSKEYRQCLEIRNRETVDTTTKVCSGGLESNQHLPFSQWDPFPTSSLRSS